MLILEVIFFYHFDWMNIFTANNQDWFKQLPCLNQRGLFLFYAPSSKGGI